MARKETLLVASMILLITYTMSISLVNQVFPQNQSSKTLSSTGNVQIQASPGIGVYQNSQATTPLTTLNWGTLEPGQSQTVTTYIKNEGTTPMTLTLETGNWNPTQAQSYLTVTWNYNSQPINPGQTAQITLTLQVNPNTTGITNFGFDITIVAY